MKIYKKIFIIFIVIVTILGLVAFSFPARNFSKSRPQSFSLETKNDYAASLAPVLPVSTSSASLAATSSTSNSAGTSFKEMSGFLDLGEEIDLVGKIGTGNSATSSGIDEIFEELD